MDEYYTPIEDVKSELDRRWNDLVLKEKVDKYFERDLPRLLQQSPKAILFRNIMTPDGEFLKFYNTAISVGIEPIGFEYSNDKFVAFNEDKYALTSLVFYLGTRNNGAPKIYNKKIVDIPNAEGKQILEIKTLWDESLNDFHHRFMEASFPGFCKSIEDISKWLHYSEGGAKAYYIDLMALLIRNAVLVEGFFSSGIENKFTEEVFIPAFKKAEEIFGVKPLLIKLCGDESIKDPSWWYYKEEQKKIVEDLININNKI